MCALCAILCPTVTHRHEQEEGNICSMVPLSLGISLYPTPICSEWQVPLGPGFGHWDVHRHSSAPSAAQGGEKYTNQPQVHAQNLLRVPFLLESQARPGEKETRK